MDMGIHLVSNTGSHERFSTFNPATGEPLGHYPLFSSTRVSAAVASAREGQAWWSRLPQRRRSAVLRRVAQLLCNERDSLAQIITSESGKPLQEALLHDVLVSADAAVFCADNAAAVLRREKFLTKSGPALQAWRTLLGAFWRNRHHLAVELSTLHSCCGYLCRPCRWQCSRA